MLHRFTAAVFDRLASSLSPPDHLLYQILKIVPVWGGGSDLIVLGSTCGRAGRRFRRMSFVFFAGGSPFSVVSEVSLFVVVNAVLDELVAGCGSVSGDADRFRDGEGGAKLVWACTTSAMLATFQKGSCCASVGTGRYVDIVAMLGRVEVSNKVRLGNLIMYAVDHRAKYYTLHYSVALIFTLQPDHLP